MYMQLYNFLYILILNIVFPLLLALACFFASLQLFAYFLKLLNYERRGRVSLHPCDYLLVFSNFLIVEEKGSSIKTSLFSMMRPMILAIPLSNDEARMKKVVMFVISLIMGVFLVSVCVMRLVIFENTRRRIRSIPDVNVTGGG